MKRISADWRQLSIAHKRLKICTVWPLTENRNKIMYKFEMEMCLVYSTAIARVHVDLRMLN